MPEHSRTYQQDADRYHELVMAEDYQHNLNALLQPLLTGKNWHCLELGAGTGRLTRMVLPWVQTLTAMDLALPMLKKAQAVLPVGGHLNICAADHRWLPLVSGRFDVMLSGWSFCYLASWYPESWRQQLDKGLVEVQRVLRPGGSMVLIETLGTGVKQPEPPQHLHSYLHALDQRGFIRHCLRTDYQFESPAQAQALTRFFFGEEMLKKIEGNILPECTGVWIKENN